MEVRQPVLRDSVAEPEPAIATLFEPHKVGSHRPALSEPVEEPAKFGRLGPVVQPVRQRS